MEEESEEDFDWYVEKEHGDNTNIVFVNKSRRRIEEGEQIFYCYGNRNNKYLLQNYGFCFPDNKRDSFSL